MPPTILASDGPSLLAHYCAVRPDRELRNRVIERYLPFARALAHRFRRTSESDEDLEQVAALGLVKAVERFDPERGAFPAYAAPTILGELRRHFRDNTWTIRPTRSVQQLAIGVRDAVDALTVELGRAPSAREIADAMGCSSEDVLVAQEALLAYETTSLDAGVSDEPELTLGETLGSDDPRFELVDKLTSLARGLGSLPDRERLIILLRFEHDMTQSEIGARIGLSQMHVSRILRGALDRVRTIADAEDAECPPARLPG